MNDFLAWLAALLFPPLGLLLPAEPQDVAALRAEGPPALERLLEKYDALPSGAEKGALERTIDAVARQRYATSSRLYWYTDLPAAEAAAHATGRPILSLRMLGRLDEELSCANSRLFRVVLYSDAELARFLRENFVLHWSSERPVPRVTIDFGDGRRIETTLAGNSAHYAMDADGRPLDVLPGLYSARAFRRELEAALPLARVSPDLDGAERTRRVKELHRERLSASQHLWSASGTPARVALEPRSAGPRIAAAETRTVAKSRMQTPLVRAARLDESGTELLVRRLDEARLDDASRALVHRLAPTDWSRDAKPVDGAALAQRMQSLEALVAADTESNETRLRAQIHAWFDSFEALPDFAALNERVYRELFLTGRDDAWLGLSNAGAFNALPHDGIVK